MNEPPEPQRRSAREMKAVAQKDSERRRAMDDRYEAARRWIGDDEESAVRGID